MHPVAIVFDLFGTLLDISSLQSEAARYSDDPSAFVATWRDKQLAYAFAAAIMDRYEDFDEITARALHYAVARHGLARADRNGDWAALTAAWCHVRPYDDALSGLTELRARGLRCAVLTNGTPRTARAAIDNAGMSDAIDVTLSVDAVRTYKPNRRVYALATAHYETSAADIMFVTANGWDATGAADFGMSVVWCNRTGSPPETFGPKPAWTVRGLAELARITDGSDAHAKPASPLL